MFYDHMLPPYCVQEVSQASIPYWRKDNLRNSIGSLKKSLDDIERQMMASLTADVSDKAKAMIAAQPDAPFVVHQFQALSSGKVSRLGKDNVHDIMKQQIHFLFPLILFAFFRVSV